MTDSSSSYLSVEQLIPTHWRQHAVIANGIRQHVLRSGGDKPPLLLLHGFMESGVSWLRLAQALAGRFDVILPDARAHGSSDLDTVRLDPYYDQSRVRIGRPFTDHSQLLQTDEAMLMRSNSFPQKLLVVLVGVWLVSSCTQPVPTEAPSVTAAPISRSSPVPATEPVAPTSQPSPLPPTEPVTPTPTEQPFVLPGGRLLLAAGPASMGKYPNTDVDFFAQYRWLDLSSLTVSPHPLLTGDYPVEDSLVILSPDRAQLAFVRKTWSKIDIAGKTYDAATSHSMLRANPDGGEAIPIGQPIPEGGVNHVMGCGDSPTWSANSQLLAFAQTPNWTSREQEHPLYLYEVASGQLKTITIRSQQDLVAFTLSPDGAQIAVTKIENTPEYALNLYVMNADGSNERVLVKGWITSNLVWHPDGTRIFFKSDRMEGLPAPGLFSVDVATGATAFITKATEQARCLALSPDESLLTYSEARGIMVVSPNGGESQLLMKGACERRYTSGLVWSPDNRYFAVVADTDPKIYVMDRAGNCKVVDYHEDKMLPLDLIGWLP